ncbi:hypothetical protein EDB86DRAFT_2839684 [Lactarius hatsudake]|nr:hypothetical protein EDB86DRAFT_2839684 [Lactarius hatsudake]
MDRGRNWRCNTDRPGRKVDKVNRTQQVHLISKGMDDSDIEHSMKATGMRQRKRQQDFEGKIGTKKVAIRRPDDCVRANTMQWMVKSALGVWSLGSHWHSPLLSDALCDASCKNYHAEERRKRKCGTSLLQMPPVPPGLYRVHPLAPQARDAMAGDSDWQLNEKERLSVGRRASLTALRKRGGVGLLTLAVDRGAAMVEIWGWPGPCQPSVRRERVRALCNRLRSFEFFGGSARLPRSMRSVESPSGWEEGSTTDGVSFANN